jgi:hypothetical protein
MEVSIPRQKLVEALEKNRSQHRAIFEEALEGYRKEAVRQLEDFIRRIKNGDLKKVYVSLPLPEEHTDEYDRALSMIAMSEDDTFILDESDYQSFVQDDWAWKRQFIASNSYYSATAAGLSDG